LIIDLYGTILFTNLNPPALQAVLPKKFKAIIRIIINGKGAYGDKIAVCHRFNLLI